MNRKVRKQVSLYVKSQLLGPELDTGSFCSYARRVATWDEQKRQANLTDWISRDAKRINLLGWSLREATKHEVRYYFKAISDEA